MTDNVQTLDYGVATSVEQRNKVLRNTYWLLALSLLPTVLGAWLGVATGITRSLTGGLGLIVFLGGAFGFIFAIEKTKNSAAGVPVLLGFTFFMGLMLSRLIAMVLGFSNGSSLVMTAFAGTAGVMFVMASLATVIKRDLSERHEQMAFCRRPGHHGGSDHQRVCRLHHDDGGDQHAGHRGVQRLPAV
jgi:modulator of FtsH protease